MSLVKPSATVNAVIAQRREERRLWTPFVVVVVVWFAFLVGGAVLVVKETNRTPRYWNAGQVVVGTKPGGELRNSELSARGTRVETTTAVWLVAGTFQGKKYAAHR